MKLGEAMYKAQADDAATAAEGGPDGNAGAQASDEASSTRISRKSTRRKSARLMQGREPA